MSKSGQAFIAVTDGHSSTMYTIMKRMGIPLTKKQEECQAYLEKTYSAVIKKEKGNV